METLNILLGLERILYNITLRPCDEEIIKEAKELIQKQGERLADYEGTGMNPQDIKDADVCLQKLYKLPVSKLSDAYDLLLAKDTGRLVVPPCKVGSHVWVIRAYGNDFDHPKEATVTKFVLHDDEIMFLEALLFMDIGEGRKEYGYSADSFGKAIFLTREEAERCLD